MVFEQLVRVRDPFGGTRDCRIITMELDTQTRDGDMFLEILTNLPADRVSAKTVAQAYRTRWEIEAVNAQLVRYLDSGQTGLGHPPATLIAFCLSLVAFNLMTIVQGALHAAHRKTRTDEQISNYNLAHQVRYAWAMIECIDDVTWERKFATLTPALLARRLKALAKKVKLEPLQKSKRGPKKPPPRGLDIRTRGTSQRSESAKKRRPCPDSFKALIARPRAYETAVN